MLDFNRERSLRALFVAMALVFASPALAEKRVALVIGNAAYVNASPLKNPGNDSMDIAAALAGLGFDVVSGSDLEGEAMRRTVKTFSDKLENADVALFYYAGHAVQVDGQNYLAPVDTDLKKEADLDFETVSLELVRKQMERQAKTQLIFLDACRNNPLGRNLGGRARSQSAGGLARLETSAEGTFIAYATQPDNVALDGDGRNSPFTTALLKHITTPGLELSELMNEVRREVYEATAKQQLPWTNSSMLGSFYFKEGEPAAATQSPQEAERAAKLEALAAEAEAWEKISGSTNTADFEAFLKQHGNSHYAELARLRLDQLAEPAKSETGSGQAKTAGETGAKQEQVVAATPQAQPESASRDAANLSPSTEEVSAIQTELARIGCNPGVADGVWGANSRKALQKAALNAGIELASLEPSKQLLERLLTVKKRICPEEIIAPVSGGAVEPVVRKKIIPVQRNKVVSVRKPAAGSNCFRFNGRLICD